MPTVNLELQMKFLSDLHEALSDAMGRYHADGAEKLEELVYMRKEVERAQKIVRARMASEDAGRAAHAHEDARVVAFS